MKSSILIFFFLCYVSFLGLYAQNFGQVDYIFIHKNTGFETIDSEKATLYFSSDSSLFIHGLGEQFGEEDSFWPEDVAWFKDKNKEEEMGSYIVDPLGQGVYKNFATQTMQFRKLFLAEAYALEEPTWPDLKWNIDAETKIISNIKCQKATTKFRGRNYTAWFAPSIPIQDGPWKLHGCPGLILEAYDDTDEVVFLFAGIQYPIDTIERKITPFPVANVHTFEAFKNAPEIEFEKMKRRALSSSNSAKSTVITRIVSKEIELEF